MEEELSVPLFVRTSRSVALSDYGERFLPYATDIVRRYFDGTRLLRETKEIKNGKVVFGAIPILPQYGITRIIAAFSARYPEDSLRVYDAGSLQLKEDLRAGRCEIAFLREIVRAGETLPAEPDLEKRLFTSDRLEVLLPSGHPLAGRTALSLPDLQKENFLMLREEPEMSQLTIDLCREAGFDPRIVLDCARFDTILDMVTMGMGIAVVSARFTELPPKAPVDPAPPFAIVPLKAPVSTRLCFAWRRQEPLSPAAAQFLSCVQDFRQEEN